MSAHDVVVAGAYLAVLALMAFMAVVFFKWEDES